LSTADAAGTWTMKLPTSAGTNLYVLQTDGSGNTSWVAQSGGGGTPGGSDTYIQFNDATAFGGNAAFTFNKTTGVITNTIAPAANTSADGIVLADTTAATAANQQYSPRLRFTGRGWKTDATAASQTVDWIVENQPVQGTANPSANLVFSSQINAGGYTSRFVLFSSGGLSLGSTTDPGSGIINVATGFRIANAATTANVLRGNGTNFVSAALAAADLSNGVTGSGSVVLTTGPTITSPLIVTNIKDTNTNILLNIGATASAVNYVKLTNAATGTAGPILAADGETNVDLKIAGKGTGGVHFTSGTYGDVATYSPAGAGTATLDCSTANQHRITMPAGNITIALSNDKAGQVLTLDIKQDATGSRTVTWFSGISWAGGTAPTLTTTASKTDTVTIRVVTAGSAYYGYLSGLSI
jgi:hypothetical protein